MNQIHKMLSYTDLEVWIHIRKLVKKVYEVTRKFPKEEIFGLTSQTRRCAVSGILNIAEGCGRYHKKDILHFMHISRGSLNELETSLYLALDFNYLTKTEVDELLLDCHRCKRLLNGFINYLEKSERRA
ncbi:MAG TPA: four helix bundle protein [Bacteroidia bacterium]|nr:four helix bundle protein [Bacteroidia bacterium]